MTDIIPNNILQANRALSPQEINFINSFMDCIPTHHNRMLNFYKTCYFNKSFLKNLDHHHQLFFNDEIDNVDFLKSINSFNSLFPHFNKSQKFALFVNTLGVDGGINGWDLTLKENQLLVHFSNFPKQNIANQICYINFVFSELLPQIDSSYSFDPIFFYGDLVTSHSNSVYKLKVLENYVAQIKTDYTPQDDPLLPPKFSSLQTDILAFSNSKNENLTKDCFPFPFLDQIQLFLQEKILIEKNYHDFNNSLYLEKKLKNTKIKI